MGHFWPLLKLIVFFKAAGTVEQISSSVKSNHQIILFKSLIHTVGAVAATVYCSKPCATAKNCKNVLIYKATRLRLRSIERNWHSCLFAFLNVFRSSFFSCKKIHACFCRAIFRPFSREVKNDIVPCERSEQGKYKFQSVRGPRVCVYRAPMMSVRTSVRRHLSPPKPLGRFG